MRSWIAIGLAAALLLGCGGSSDDGTGAETAQASGETGKQSGGGKKVGPDGQPAVAAVMFEVAHVCGTPRPLHDGQVEAIRAHPDGKHFITASADGSVVIWSYDGWKPVRSINAGKRLYDVAISADGKRLCTSDGTLILSEWDAATGEALESEIMYPARRRNRKPMGLAYAQKDAAVLMGGSEAGLKTSAGGGNVDGVRGACIERIARSADGKLLATACPRSVVTVLERDSLKRVAVINTSARDVALTADGARAIAIAEDGSTRLYDAKTGQVVTDLGKLGAIGRSVAIAEDGAWMAAGGLEGKLVVWDGEGNKKAELAGHAGAVTALLATPAGKLISGDSTGTMLRWDPLAGKLDHPGAGHAGAIGGLVWSKNGKQLTSVGADGQLLVWSASSGKVQEKAQFGESLTALAHTADGAPVVGGGAGALAILKSGDFKLLRRLSDDRKKGNPRINDLAVAGDVAIAGVDMYGMLVAIDLASGDVEKEIRQNDVRERVHSLATADDGSFVVYGTQNKRDIFRLALPDLGPAPKVGDGGPPITALDVVGNLVVNAGKGICFAVPTDGGKAHRYAFPQVQFNDVALIAADGVVLALAAEHLDRDNFDLMRVGKVLLFKADGRQPYQQLVGQHVRPVRHLALSPDGKYLASGGVDGAVVIYARK